MERTKPGWALIIAGGNPVQPALVARLQEASWVVAADSGLDQANRLQIRPDLVIGDMDSVTTEALAEAVAAGIKIERHPTDKDATDLELAINAASAAGYQRATIIGGTGGRMAHTIANAMLLIPERDIELDWLTSHARITALRTNQTGAYPVSDGPLLSVLAVGGPATCLSTGLRWPLDGAPLVSGSTRGISNEILGDAATIQITSGQALIIHERN